MPHTSLTRAHGTARRDSLQHDTPKAMARRATPAGITMALPSTKHSTEVCAARYTWCCLDSHCGTRRGDAGQVVARHDHARCDTEPTARDGKQHRGERLGARRRQLLLRPDGGVAAKAATSRTLSAIKNRWTSRALNVRQFRHGDDVLVRHNSNATDHGTVANEPLRQLRRGRNNRPCRIGQSNPSELLFKERTCQPGG